MKNRWVTFTLVFLAVSAALSVTLWFAGKARPSVFARDLAGHQDQSGLNGIPTVTAIHPDTADNDLDTPVVVSGTGFTTALSGTLVITPPTAYLGSIPLEDVIWMNSTTLSATVPWGLDAGVYTLTVINPDGMFGTLPNAFTVTQGIGVWTTGGPYGGEVWYVTLHPITPTWVYAAADFTGMFFSSDSAADWQLMFLHGQHAGRLSFDPQTPEVMFFSNGQLYRTWDSGYGWECIMPPNPNLQDFILATHPISSGVIYAGASAPHYRPIDPGEEGALYRSEDWGDSWFTITTGLTDTHITAIAFHPEDPSTMLVGTRNGHVFLSTDGGYIWSWAAHVHSHVARLYFNPFEPQEAWATTAPPVGPKEPPFIFRSLGSDFDIWLPITVTDASAVPSLIFHPTLSGTLWAAGGSGHVSTDGGNTWLPLVGGPSSVMDFAIDPVNPHTIYAGTRHDGVFINSDGDSTWNEANQGLAGIVPDYLAVSPRDPYEVYAYAQTLGLIKTKNGGGSWRSLDVLRCGIAWAQNPLVVDPFIPRRVYLGESWTAGCSAGPQENGIPGLRISEDSGQTWHVVTMTVPDELIS